MKSSFNNRPISYTLSVRKYIKLILFAVFPLSCVGIYGYHFYFAATTVILYVCPCDSLFITLLNRVEMGNLSTPLPHHSTEQSRNEYILPKTHYRWIRGCIRQLHQSSIDLKEWSGLKAVWFGCVLTTDNKQIWMNKWMNVHWKC